MNRLARSLNVAAGEGRPVVFLFIHTFFQGVVIAFYNTGANALFLEQFRDDQQFLFIEGDYRHFLPIGYIASAALGFVVANAYRKVERRTSFKHLLLGSFGFLLISVGALSVISLGEQSPLLAFVIFMWYGGTLMTLPQLVYQGLTDRFFNLRQGKRLLGMISNGGTLSNIIAYLSIPVLLSFGILELVHLFVLCAVALALWLVFLLILNRSFPEQLSARNEPAGNTANEARETQKTDDGLGLFSNRYTVLICALTILPILSLNYVDYVFLGLTQEVMTAAPAAFLGVFFGASRIVEFLFKLFVSGNLISHYGVRFTLLALPTVLAVFVSLALVAGLSMDSLSGVLGAEVLPMVFFAPVILCKVFERIIRTSINDPSVQVLYQTVPGQDRAAFRAKVTGSARQLGIALVGVTLLALAFNEGSREQSDAGVAGQVQEDRRASADQAPDEGAQDTGAHTIPVLTTLLIIVAAWIFAVRAMRRQYQVVLQELLETEAESVGSRGLLQSAETLQELRERHRDLNHDEILVSLRLMERLEPALKEDVLIKLLSHPQSETKLLAVTELGRAQVISSLDAVKALDNAAEVEEISEAARETVKELLEAKETLGSPSRHAELARSPIAHERLSAARLFGQGTNGEADHMLLALLRDHDPNVRRRLSQPPAKAATLPSGRC